MSSPGTAGMAGDWNLPVATTTLSKRSVVPGVTHQPSGVGSAEELDPSAEPDARHEPERLGIATQVVEDVAA